jgi:polyhydroxybutyrate depolymerase
MGRARSTLRVTAAFLVGLLALGWWGLSFESVPEPELAGDLLHQAIEWETRERSYLVYRPSRPAQAPAIVFVLHASMGDGAMARRMTGYEFDRLAEEQGFLAVYPDGFDRHWNGCRKAGPYEANRLDIDDVGFLRSLAQRLRDEEGADGERVFATGVSNGGQMSLRLALEAPDLVRAVAPVAASMPTSDNMGCAPSGEPVAVMIVNGTDDPMNPYEGGKVAFYGVWGDRGNVHSSLESARYWAELAGHEDPPTAETLPDRSPSDGSVVERRVWSGPTGPEVALYSVVGGGHSMPHPRLRSPRIVGGSNADIDGPREIWAFFERAGERATE